MPQPLKIGDSLDVIEVTRTNYPNDWKVGDVLLAEKDPELSGYEVKSKVHDMYLYYGCGMYYIINAASFHVYELQNLRKMDKKYTLPNEFGEKWVEALRSGEYEQGDGSLFKKETCAFCCLGVAGLICGLEKDDMQNVGDLSDIDFISKNKMPIQLFDDGYYLQLEAMDLNDNQKMSFPQIADWLEQNVKFV